MSIHFRQMELVQIEETTIAIIILTPRITSGRQFVVFIHWVLLRDFSRSIAVL